MFFFQLDIYVVFIIQCPRFFFDKQY